ncbi:MAG: peptide chain release factor N(5)-glutamine methyltransferase [Kiritimatiellae bacterium]|nr:peptide chain release factor N(5)-glutamine methyltransferase [Kiritimatiellia bacterium]
MASLGSILDAVIARVQTSVPDESRLKCEWLASRVLCCSRLELALRREQCLTPLQVRQIEEGAARLAGGEPLQYILGEAEFMGRVFACDRRALIPRPETEQLAAWVLEDTRLWQNKAPSFTQEVAGGTPVVADVGTGSGCIAISLALERPEGRYLATDTSAAALALARENAARHGVSARIRFVACDLLSAAPSKTTFQHSAECWNVVTADSTTFASLDAVVSNPPYVRTTDWAQLERSVRDCEPRAALDGGPDGLAVIRRLVAQAFQALKPGGVFFLEIGEDQGTAVLDLARAAGFRESHVRPDLAGKDRMVLAVK